MGYAGVICWFIINAHKHSGMCKNYRRLLSMSSLVARASSELKSFALVAGARSPPCGRPLSFPPTEGILDKDRDGKPDFLDPIHNEEEPSLCRSPGCRQARKSPHIVGLFCPYNRSLLTLFWSAQACRRAGA